MVLQQINKRSCDRCAGKGGLITKPGVFVVNLIGGSLCFSSRLNGCAFLLSAYFSGPWREIGGAIPPVGHVAFPFTGFVPRQHRMQSGLICRSSARYRRIEPGAAGRKGGGTASCGAFCFFPAEKMRPKSGQRRGDVFLEQKAFCDSHETEVNNAETTEGNFVFFVLRGARSARGTYSHEFL